MVHFRAPLAISGTECPHLRQSGLSSEHATLFVTLAALNPTPRGQVGGQWSILLVISPSATMAEYITESVANYATQIDYRLLSTPLDFQVFPKLIVPTEFLTPVLH